MKKMNALMGLLLMTIPLIAGADSKSTASISKQELRGFEQCELSDALKAKISRLMTSQKPLKKQEGVWTFAAQGSYFDLPFTAVQIGVCNQSGERDCGWGSYFALVIPEPFAEVKKSLKKSTGIDFTKEVREEEFENTLRPILGSQSREESLLRCDPGSL